jgi:CheY-like chemotaxis protein
MRFSLLIVDDSKLARLSVVRALRILAADYTTLEAADAEEALALARKSPVDIALLDYNMPGRNGLEVATELRALHPAMPLAIISANTQTEIVDGAHALGAAFLPKPLKEAALNAFLVDAASRLGAARQ